MDLALSQTTRTSRLIHRATEHHLANLSEPAKPPLKRGTTVM